LAALRVAAAAADRVIARLQQGDIALVGRTEAQVSRQIAEQLVAEGHEFHNFSIVAAGANAASPHHHADDTVIQSGQGVLFDIGGTYDGYCSDITRCVYLGEPDSEFQDAYDVLFEAQAAGVAAATVGTTFEDIDAASRQIIEDAGYGKYFMHRVGHGIGMSAHEDPYLVSGNTARLEAGHCFSIEPGIYIEGKFGMRLEDIVIAHESGPEPINLVPHELAVIDA
jgi:Xaa-Pro aminopeptidase